MGLLDAILGAPSFGGNSAPTLEALVASELGLRRATSSSEGSVAAATGWFQDGSGNSVIEGPRAYVFPGLPPQTQMQIGTASSSLRALPDCHWSQLIGILFCMPTTRIGKDEIIPHLEYFHHRSSSKFNLFCPGFHRIDPNARQATDSFAWHFDFAEYNKMREEVELASLWRYSGETDLLLLQVVEVSNSIRLDFSSVIACNLEQLLRDSAITSVRAFVEQVVRFAETASGVDLSWQFSDHMAGKIGVSALLDAVLAMFPKSAAELYKTARHFVVRDVSSLGAQ